MYLGKPIAYMLRLKFTDPVNIGNIHRSFFNFVQIFHKALYRETLLHRMLGGGIKKNTSQ